jgi:hypothetical protein
MITQDFPVLFLASSSRVLSFFSPVVARLGEGILSVQRTRLKIAASVIG